MGVALAVFSLVSSVYSANEQRKEKKKQSALVEKQAKEQREIAKVQKKRQEVANNRAVKQRIREYLSNRGELENQAANFGVSDSSGAAGGIGSLQSQVAGQVGFASGEQQASSKIFGHQDNISQQGIQIAQSQAREGKYAAIGQASSSIFAATGGFGPGASIWDTKKAINLAGPITSTSSQSEAKITQRG
jgi:hypothetical protein